MAESDPKKIRPYGQTSDRRNLDSEEDPLVELARIVSEDNSFYGPRGDRAKARREEAIDRNAYSADLESELLQELESSFSSRSTPTPAARTLGVARAAPENASPKPPADDADDLLRSIEKQLGEFERRTQTTRPAAPPQPAGPRVEPGWDRSDPARHVEPAEDLNVAPEPVDDWAPRREFRDRSPTETPDRDARERNIAEARARIAGMRPPGDRDAEDAQRRTEARMSRAAPIISARDADDGGLESTRLPLRRRDPPLDAERDYASGAVSGFAARAAGGWNELESDEPTVAAPVERDRRTAAADYRGDLRTTFGGFDDSHGTGQVAAEEEPEFETRHGGELAADYSDPTFATDWQESDGLVHESAAVAPAPAAMDYDNRRAAARRTPSRAGLLAAVGVLAVVVIGGAAAMYMRSGEEVPSGPPPVIAAPEGDTKIEPPQAQAEGETVGDAVYDRVAGNAPPAEEQVVDAAEEPREISRIVLPPPQENSDQALVRSVGEGGDAAAAADAAPAGTTAAAEDIGPRRVRTYVVRPDGTIAETAATPADAAPAQEQQVAAATPAESEPMVPVRVATTEVDGTGQTAAVQPEPASGAAAPAVAPAAPAAEPAPVETAAAEATPESAPAAALPDASQAPTDLLSAAPAQEQPAPAPAPASADGYVVQISSQRTMEDAQSSWSSAQRRYASVLGDMEPNIQQADLGAKGIYYRVRVGPWPSRAEAVQVCESLRSAGGDCIVTR